MKVPDVTLLTAFARHGDEAAFRALAERHLGLVFHTALRRTGNRTLSEEVAQNVLCALAAKAGTLTDRPEQLPGWLHRATVYESSKAMRAESSRQRRQQLQHPDAIPTTGHAENATWNEALPHLDLALNKLPEADRRVLLLHFFENLSFPKIAGQLGKSSATVQKQSIRALEKLSRLLRSKGVIIPVTVLATGLTAEFAKAAPAALLSSATTAALTSSAGGVTSGLAFMISTHSKVILPCALLICALPLGLQQVAISKAEREVSTLRTLSSHLSKTSRSRATATNSKPAGNLDVMALADEMLETLEVPGSKWTAFQRKLEELDATSLARLINQTATAEMNRETKGKLLAVLTETLASSDSSLAMTTLVDSLRGNPAFPSLLQSANPTPVFAEWIRQDPAAAQAWLIALAKDPQLSPERLLRTGENNPLAQLQASLIAMLVRSNGNEAVSYLESQPEFLRTALIQKATGLLSSEPANSRNDGSGYVPIINKFVPKEARAATYQCLIGSLRTYEDLTRIEPILRHPEITPEDRRLITIENAIHYLEKWQLTGDISGQKLDQWLQKIIPDEADSIAIEARQKFTSDNDTHTGYLIESLRNSPEKTDETLVLSLTTERFGKHLSEAVKLADRIKDPAKRAKVLEKLNATQQP